MSAIRHSDIKRLSLLCFMPNIALTFEHYCKIQMCLVLHFCPCRFCDTLYCWIDEDQNSLHNGILRTSKLCYVCIMYLYTFCMSNYIFISISKIDPAVYHVFFQLFVSHELSLNFTKKNQAKYTHFYSIIDSLSSTVYEKVSFKSIELLG